MPLGQSALRPRRFLPISSRRPSAVAASPRVACTRTQPCTTRSATSTRATPSGNKSRAAISATEGRSAHSVRIWPRASLLGQRGGGGGVTASTDASSGSSTPESVRPAVSVYGRTRLGSSTFSLPSGATWSMRRSRVLWGAPRGLDDGPHPFHQNRHLVADLADVAVVDRQRREVGPVADPHQQQVTVL